MAKSRIGPFALEAPLSKQKGSVQLYRGVHVEQRKLAAVQVFPIPMGMTPESRKAFASQLEQLKQLRHRGIVRCYGGGFDNRNAFLAYELVDGESLKDSLARRDRLPWETAIDYCQQLAEALQYSHQMGWIHGRLRPASVLVEREGIVKIGDWRREAISAIVDFKADAEQFQCSSPEVLAGSAADEKSDLYSLGCIMYKMLTGQLPFSGNAPQQVAASIDAGEPEAVGSLVLDCPVWLNAIVQQLLARDPRQRPFSATALQLAFKEAQRRQVEGVGVLQHAAAGFSPLQMKVDRDEAEKVLGIKPKKKRRSNETPLFERWWVLVGALALALALVVWFLLPLNEDTLRARSATLLASDKWMDWNDARDTYLGQIVERFPDGEHAEWAQEQIAWVDAREAERRMERDERLGRKDNWTQAQVQYAEARKFELFGDLATAFDKYRAIISLFSNREDDRPLVFLAREGVNRIKEKGLGENALQNFLTEKLAEANRAYEQARITEAKLKWESIVELYDGNQEVAPLVEEALSRLNSINQK